MVRNLTLILTFFFVLGQQTVSAATIELRPELYGHLTQLKRIYPPQAPSDIAGSGETDFTEVDIVEKRENSTVIYVGGVIKKGDANSLKKILQDSRQYYAGIVFDSPGGNFLEGLKLAKIIRGAWGNQDPNLGGVFVLKNSQCLSACALAFAGSVDPYHNQNDVRFIEEGAQLGFHMGILPSDSAEQLVQANEMLSMGYDIVAEYTALIAANRNPPALLQAALKHRDASSFYLVGSDIAAWALGFSPVSSGISANQIKSTTLDESLANKICNTILAYGKIFKTGAEMEFGQFVDYGRTKSDAIINSLSSNRPLSALMFSEVFTCQIEINSDNKISAFIWRGKGTCVDRKTDRHLGWCLSSRKKVWQISTAMLANALGCPNGQFSKAGTNYYYEKKRTGTVKRDVNMRSSPSLRAGIVKQLKADTKVVITDCRIVDDSQNVWFAISGDTGSGWVSARFIYEFHSLPASPLEFSSE